MIDASLLAAQAGRGALTLVEGPPRIGKTELLAAAMTRARRRGMLVLSARAGELERSFPYAVVRQLFEAAVTQADRAARGRMLSGAAVHAASVVDPHAKTGSVTIEPSAVLHGLYWLTANLATEQPILTAAAHGNTLSFARHSTDLGELCDATGLHSPAVVPWRSDLALALAGSDRHDEAVQLAVTELRLAEQCDVDRARGHALRTLGLLEGGESGLQHLDAAMQAFARSPARLELGWANYELGAALRRATRRRDARAPLDRALDIAMVCGARTARPACQTAARGARRAAAKRHADRRRGADALRTALCRLAADGLRTPRLPRHCPSHSRRSSTGHVAWMSEADERAARERWPGWVAGLLVDEPFAERAARMEGSLRQRRMDGDGQFVVVTIDIERYAAWCEGDGHDPVDRRSRGTFVNAEREAGAGRAWPPGRNEPCWCGSERKYKRCCGGLATRDLAASGV